MKELHLRDNPVSGYGEDNLKGYEFLVTDYENGGYDGCGTAYALKEGEVIEFNLSHCSCYGPFESTHKNYSLDEFKNIVNSEDVTIGTIEDLTVAKRFLEFIDGK